MAIRQNERNMPAEPGSTTDDRIRSGEDEEIRGIGEDDDEEEFEEEEIEDPEEDEDEEGRF